MSRAPMPDYAKGEQPMPSSFDDDLEFWDEGRLSKLWRRLKEEPLIPLGLAMTCYALYGATKSIRRGDKEQTNRFFRARLYAQGFTIVCIVVGSLYWKGDRDTRKHYQGLLSEKRAREKKDAWIRELEARDREDEIARKIKEVQRAGRKSGKDNTAIEAEVERIVRETRAEHEVAMKAEAAKRQQEENTEASMVGRDELRALLAKDSILGPAMRLWWSK